MQRQFWMLLLALSLLALLPLLAVMQYRWLGQVSEGERERKKNVLTASAMQFCHDFDAELTSIYMSFHPSLGGPADINSDQSKGDFSARYRRWRETAAHPKMIKEVYQTQNEKYGERLSLYNAGTGVFEACEWPASMSNLHKRLEEERASDDLLKAQIRESINLKLNTHGENGARKMLIHLNSYYVDEDLPGLVIPISDRPDQGVMPILAPRFYRIIALDGDYISRELIPELARRHFGDSATEYTIAVTKRGRADQFVFRSDESVPAMALAEADVRAGFFKILFEEIDRFFFAQWVNLDADAPSGVPARLRTQSNRRLKSRQIAIHVTGNLKTNPNKSENAATPLTHDIVPSLFNRHDEGAWRLVAKHRAGSLEAAVTIARRRNLAISFGILSLLVVSVGFIMLSSRRAERLATQRMEFVAGVSHELRTPLAVICSAAENLADGVVDDRDQMRRYGGLIRNEGRRLTGMVEQILEFAGAQSGQKSYELRPADLNPIIESAVTAWRLEPDEGGFEIERKIAANLPKVKADADALSRAIQNLLSNATKYGGDSRWIGLSAESVKTANGDEIQIKVSDRGLGVPPSELQRIFEPFYRGKEAQAAQIRGNGLGLNLVKHIITAHGGRVSVESKVGQGSAFILHLPI
ncbi:MAG: HAMP domain-containing histidine kinase [Chloracidobacterium sp.]|nr:HAMP domain-containing histidine kinase [Chloracidobacterium sp.]